MILKDEPVEARYAQMAPLAAEVVRRLHDVIEKLGFDTQVQALLTPDEAIYRLERDPANGEYSLIGDWRDPQGIKVGELLFHADGSFYVEQDVAQPHPSRARWFVEAVNAWGRDGQVKAEARLLPLPE